MQTRKSESQKKSPALHSAAAQPELGPDPGMHWISFIAIAAFFLALIAYNFVDIDLWHQMALIRESLAAGHLLRADPFAYTPTLRPWIDHEWGAGVIAFYTTRWLGAGGILLVKFLMALGTGLFCWRAARRAGTDFRLWTACAPLAIFLAHLGFFAAIRAQVYSFFFVALLMYFWELDRKGSRRWIVLWLLLFPLWINLHGGFVAGIGLMGLHTVEQLLRRAKFRHLLAVLAIMLWETLLTPYGTTYFGYLRRALFMNRPFVPEWRPVWDLGPFWVICLTAACAVVVYAVASAGFQKIPGILVLAATAIEAALHRKLLPLFAIAWLCCVPLYLQQTPAGAWVLDFLRHRRKFVLAAWATLACASVIAAARLKPWETSVPQPLYSVGPVSYLVEQKFSGNLMVPFRLGAYVSWKLFPAVKVSLDSRYEETYSDELMNRLFGFYEAEAGWQAALTAYPTDLVLIPRDAAVSKRMPETGWQRVYVDKEFELYARPGLALRATDWSSQSFRGTFP